jgi:hypothetical protein
MSTHSRVRKAPSAWRRWRTSRPFWGGLLVSLGGAEILLAVKAPLPVVLHVGMQGLVGYLVPVVLLLCGILLLANPAQRLFYSTIAAVLTLASWATSNLGGFFLGLILGLLGSALAFAWTPEGRAKTQRTTMKATPASQLDTATEAGTATGAATEPETGTATEVDEPHHSEPHHSEVNATMPSQHARTEESAG